MLLTLASGFLLFCIHISINVTACDLDNATVVTDGMPINGTFCDKHFFLNVIKQEKAMPKIPPGKKENVTFVVSNDSNKKRFKQKTSLRR
jgi:hypothetical protein